MYIYNKSGFPRVLFFCFFFLKFSHVKVLLNKRGKDIFIAKQYKQIAIHFTETLVVLKVLSSQNTYKLTLIKIKLSE